MADYPSIITTKPSVIIDDTLSIATSHEKVFNEIIAIQTELDTNPSGSFSTVKARLDALLPAIESELRFEAGAGYGATNTKIPYFTNELINTGTGMSFVNNATLGLEVTVVESGIYGVMYTHTTSSSSFGGLSLNSSQLTTNIQAITAADRLCFETPGANTWGGTCYIVRKFVVNDIFRPHTDGQSVTGKNLGFHAIKIRGIL